MKNLTVIIPVYNEGAGLRKTISTLCDYNIKNRLNWEIIAIDDGSNDDSAEILKEMSGIRVLTHPYNKGYGASIKSGIRAAATDLLAFYDADGQHNPADLLALLKNMGEYDLLVGRRGKDSFQDWIRKPGKWILAKLANFLTGRKIPDLNSGLRVVKRDIINKLFHLFPDSFSFSTTSTIAFMNMGYNVGYFPIKVNKRIGKSTIKQLKHGSSTILLMLRLIVLFNPLKVFIPVSFYLLVLGVLYEVIFGIVFIPGIKIIPGALLLILSGILVFFFGLVVDQISELRKHLYLKE